SANRRLTTHEPHEAKRVSETRSRDVRARGCAAPVRRTAEAAWRAAWLAVEAPLAARRAGDGARPVRGVRGAPRARRGRRAGGVAARARGHLAGAVAPRLRRSARSACGSRRSRADRDARLRLPDAAPLAERRTAA